jgi:hypothetical protein
MTPEERADDFPRDSVEEIREIFRLRAKAGHALYRDDEFVVALLAEVDRLAAEAVVEIARLTAENERLQTALKMMLDSHDLSCKGEDCPIIGVDLARAALEQKP